jgi:signal transduction histidine kinase
MQAFHKLKKSNTLRWFFLGLGLLAVVALTVLNIYSLYALQESTVEAAKENRKIQLEEFSQKVRFRFYQPFRGIRNLDMNEIELSWNTYGAFPEHFNSVLNEAINDSLFTDIYYTPDHMKGCFKPDYPLYKFDPESELFSMTNSSPKEVCDGFGLSKSRMNTVDLENYNWNNRTMFDSHRTMTLALINPDHDTVLGHVTFLIDQDYLLNGVLKPMLAEDFGNSAEAGMVVWIRNWIMGEILLTNNTDIAYNRDNVDIYQRFPDLLDNWIIQASFIESPFTSATSASLNRNLMVLGIAVFILFGALVFMFINAQKEREFAERQAGFLANVTHELKTPLALMQAAGENISDGRVSEGERLKNYGEHIYSEAIRLRKMIDKLLDVAKSDSNRTMAKQAPYQLNELANNFIESKREYIESKGFSLSANMDSNLPPVMIDHDHFETILGNLLENSIKYSWDRKEISVHVYADKKQVYLSVADKGQGIPKKAQKNIFKKFYRVENSMTAQTKGHGLGLSIVKNMVQLNGGTISVNSEPGKGSEFIVAFHALFNQHQKDKAVQKSDDPKNIAEVTLETYG